MIGLAGVAGVAATGIVVVRAQRRRKAYTPEEIRARLHARHAEVVEAGEPEKAAEAGQPEEPGQPACVPGPPRRADRCPRQGSAAWGRRTAAGAPTWTRLLRAASQAGKSATGKGTAR